MLFQNYRSDGSGRHGGHCSAPVAQRADGAVAGARSRTLYRSNPVKPFALNALPLLKVGQTVFPPSGGPHAFIPHTFRYCAATPVGC
jgi:hypothetical protein